MLYWKRNLYILWFGCFVSSMSYTLVVPFMSLFLQELNAVGDVETWAGVCLSASYLMSGIMSPLWGSMADRYGRKTMIVRAGIGMALCYALQYFVTAPYQLLALRTLNGFFAGFIPASTALIACNTPEDQIGASLGVVQTASAAGNIMGPLAGGILATIVGMRLTFLMAGGVLFISTIVVAMLVHETAPRVESLKFEIAADFRHALANSQLAMVLVASAFVQAALSVLQPILSLRIAEMDPGTNASLMSGIVYSIAGLATVIGAPIWAGRGRRTGYKKVLVIGLVGAGIFNLPQAFVTSIAVFGVLRFFVGFSTAGVTLSVNAVTARSVDSTFRGRAFGILTSFNQLGAMTGPIMGGIIGSRFGLRAAFLAAAVMFLGTSVLAQRLLPSDVPEALVRGAQA
jgi:MFS transporter, DHA1 family, multidrug resistance protein